MRTFSVVKGLSVVALTTGEEIGKVIDMTIHETKVSGFVIDKNGWLNRHLFVQLESIQAIGQDAMTIIDLHRTTIFDKKQAASQAFYLWSKNMKGKSLLSAEGEKLGLVDDVYFQEGTGMIVGYEVTDGLIADIKEGKRVMKTELPLTVGEDVLVIELNG